ncbi:MAG: hypothetical protein ACLGG0_01365 [Bacteriovoracia bacterium]
MKSIALALLFSTSAWGAHLDTVCKATLQPMPGDQSRMLTNAAAFTIGFVARRIVSEEGARFVLENNQGDEVYVHAESIKSLATLSNEVWAVSAQELLQFDLNGSLIASHSINTHPALANQARGMSAHEGIIFLARGRGGVAAFDSATQKIKWETRLNEIKNSMAINVVTNGNKLYVIMTGTAEGGFNGVATLEAQTGKVLQATPYDYRRAGVIYPETPAHMWQDKLVLNNGGWIHVLTEKDLLSSKSVRPRWVAHVVGEGQRQHYMMLRGDFFFENDTLVGCGVYHVNQGDDFSLESKVFRVPMP